MKVFQSLRAPRTLPTERLAADMRGKQKQQPIAGEAPEATSGDKGSVASEESALPERAKPAARTRSSARGLRGHGNQVRHGGFSSDDEETKDTNDSDGAQGAIG